MFNDHPAVLPRLERMLAAAADERIEHSAASSQRSRSRFSVPRIAAVALAATAFTGTAMAATGLWDPAIGDLTPDNPPAAVSATPVPAAMAESIGAFRRAPQARDHGPAVEATLSTLGNSWADGIRPESVRYLGENASGEATILLSAERSLFTSGSTASDFGTGEPACVLVPTAREAISLCFGLNKILAGQAMAEILGVEHLREENLGLVPDGVATVTTRFGDGSVHEVPVTDNFFSYQWEDPEAGPIDSEFPIVRWTTPNRIETVWRDAEGNVVPQQPAG